jgi:peroxiredoxin Q/BCP
MTLKKGDKAPQFCGLNEKGEKVLLSDFKGKKLALYFYPQDGTPTCTTQACNLRDNFEKLNENGIVILGVSSDSSLKHQNFIAKKGLPFSLIADTELEIHKLYGTWGEKTNFGKTYFGTIRTTFLIDENGFIAEIIAKVHSKNHADEILAAWQ